MKRYQSRVILGIPGTSLDQMFLLLQSWLIFGLCKKVEHMLDIRFRWPVVLSCRAQWDSCVDKKSSFSHWDSSSKQCCVGHDWSLLGPIRGILSHVTASGYIFQLTFRSLSNIFIIWWVSDEKSFQVCQKNMAVFSSCSKVLQYQQTI